MIDYTDLYWTESTVYLNEQRVARTNAEGIASFMKVTLVDVANTNTCVRFVFFVGDPSATEGVIPTVRSEPSEIYCFKNNVELYILNMPSLDKYISP
jgi:hypothetical protein